MDRARRLLPLLGINAIPVAGVFLGGWSGATALTLYWWENLVGSLLVALRLVIHRRLTGKRGYQRLQLGLNSNQQDAETRRRREQGKPPRLERPGSFLTEFLVAACAATLVHGLLLWFFVAKVLDRGADGVAVRQGVLAVAAFQVAAFAFDLRGLRLRPFAWVREQAQMAVNRVLLIHLVILAAVWFGLRHGAAGVVGPFVVLKAMADVGNALARAGVRADSSEEAPAWLAATMNRLGSGRGDDFATYWHLQKAEEHRLQAQDEQVSR